MPEEVGFDYDPDWPQKSKVWTQFNQREDKLILKYLLKTGQVSGLGGNLVWKKLATSKKYNPGRRTFHSLRDRYRAHLVKCLGRYLKPEDQEKLLQKSPGSVAWPKFMKPEEDAPRKWSWANILLADNTNTDNAQSEKLSGEQSETGHSVARHNGKKFIKKSLQTPTLSSDSEDEIQETLLAARSNVSASQTVTSGDQDSPGDAGLTLVHRSQVELVSHLQGQNATVPTSTSSIPVDTDCSRSGKNGNSNVAAEDNVSEDENNNNKAKHPSHVWSDEDTMPAEVEKPIWSQSQSDPGQKTTADEDWIFGKDDQSSRLLTGRLHSAEHDGQRLTGSTRYRGSSSPEKAGENELLSSRVSMGNDTTLVLTVTLNRRPHVFDFEFARFNTVLEDGPVHTLLDAAQNQLRDVIEGHAEFQADSPHQPCPDADCAGLEAYLNCWADLRSALLRVDRHRELPCEAFFSSILLARFLEVLRAPVCRRSAALSYESVNPQELYSFLCNDGKVYRNLIDTCVTLAEALQAVRVSAL